MPPEDQADFERILDEALRSARLAADADRFEIERLRSLAMDALPEIAAAADEEYRQLVRLRAELGASGADAPGAGPGGPGKEERSAGVGLLAVVTTLVPVLSAIAAVVFLLLGYALRLADPEPGIAERMRGVGWVFAAVAGLGLLVALGGLVVAATRNSASTAIRASAPAEELARARDEWRRALHDRGVVPFVRRAGGRHHPRGRTPRLRFSSPDFSSPDFSSSAGVTPRARPRHGNPRFSGPEFGSPAFTSPADGDDELVDPRFSRPDFSGPDFSGPDFDSPDFTSPARDDDEPADRRYGSPDFSRPEFGSPEFGSPDFTSPARDDDEPPTRPGYASPDFGGPADQD
ncbi:membrane protein [Streptomyces mayteni]